MQLLKQLQSLVAGGLPLLATRLQSVFPFLNPQIADEMWPMTSILALISSGVTFNLARRFQKPTHARRLCLWGLAFAIVSFIFLFLLIGNLVLTGHPEWQDFFARTLFVTLFVGIGLVVGWCFSHVL
jgi:hypothetical protein